MLTLSSIAGNTRFVEQLKKHVIEPIKGGSPLASRRVIIYGPAGSGKGFVANAVAGELGLEPKKVLAEDSVDEMEAKASSTTEKSLLLVDQIEAAWADPTKRKILEMVGKKVLVVGASSRPWMLDDIVKEGYGSLIFMPEPDLEARKGMLRNFLGDDAKVDPLAEATEDYMPLELYKVIDEIGDGDLLGAYKKRQAKDLSEWVSEAKNHAGELDAKAFKPLLDWLKER